ncbi:MAG: hypothetical protein COA33_003415 [Fluviicola sp.]|nr:hypothetical protein [Fluviicola sp.]
MEKDIIDIVTEKEFIQLTASEKSELHEFCKTEEEYNQLKAVFASVSAMPIDTPSPKAETKRDLDALFAQTHPRVAPIWYNSVFAVIVPKDKPIYRQPILQVAAVALLFLLAVPMFSNDIVQEPTKLAKNENIETNDKATDKVKENELTKDMANDQLDVNQLETIVQDEESDIVSPADTRTSLAENSFPFTLTLEPSGNDRSRKDNSPILLDENRISMGLEGTPTPMAASGSVSNDFFDHPDGVFAEDKKLEAASSNDSDDRLSFAISASETDDLMDLLTVTF